MTGQPSFRPSRPLITGVPREEDLLVLHELAKNTRGIMVEQPFDLGTGIAYCLQTVVGRRAGEEDPTWYLYSGPTKTNIPTSTATRTTAGSITCRTLTPTRPITAKRMTTWNESSTSVSSGPSVRRRSSLRPAKIPPTDPTTLTPSKGENSERA